MDKVKKSDFLDKRSHFSTGKTWERKKKRKREVQDFFRRSSEFRRSEFVKLRIKVHRLDEGYMHVPKMRDFIEDPNEEI